MDTGQILLQIYIRENGIEFLLFGKIMSIFRTPSINICILRFSVQKGVDGFPLSRNVKDIHRNLSVYSKEIYYSKLHRHWSQPRHNRCRVHPEAAMGG